LCGGCELQHIDEESLAVFVQERVLHALASQQVQAETVMPVHLSPAATRRRIAVRSAWAGRNFQLGFSTEKSHRIIDLQQCEVMAPELFALMKPLRAFLAPRVAQKRNVQVKLALIDQGVDLLIENLTIEGLEAHEALSAFASENRLARLSLDDGFGPTTLWEPEPATITLGGAPVAYPPYAFLQATRDGEAALVAAEQLLHFRWRLLIPINLAGLQSRRRRRGIHNDMPFHAIKMRDFWPGGQAWGAALHGNVIGEAFIDNQTAGIEFIGLEAEGPAAHGFAHLLEGIGLGEPLWHDEGRAIGNLPQRME
jgi:hypothetical protein